MKQICSFLIVLFLLIHLSSCNTILPPAETDPTGETTEETAESTTEEETVAPEWVDAWTPTTPRYFQGLESDPWYFSWDPRESVIVYMRDHRAWNDLGGEIAFKTPLQYETSASNLLVRFEFFQEYHLPGSFLQMRVTLMNCGEASVNLSYRTRNASLAFPDAAAGDARAWCSPDELKLIRGSRCSFSLSPGESYSFDRILTLRTADYFNRIAESGHDITADATVKLMLSVNEESVTIRVPVQTVDSIEAPELPEGDVVTDAPSINHNWVNEWTATTPKTDLPKLEGLPWYFSWYPEYFGSFSPESEGGKKVLVTPLRYEIAQPGLIFRFEFFEEYHLPDSICQVRVTVINSSDEITHIFHSSEDDLARIGVKWTTWARDVFCSEEEMMFNRGLDGVAIFDLYPGESYSFERVIDISSEEHLEDGVIQFRLKVNEETTKVNCPVKRISAGEMPS